MTDPLRRRARHAAQPTRHHGLSRPRRRGASHRHHATRRARTTAGRRSPRPGPPTSHPSAPLRRCLPWAGQLRTVDKAKDDLFCLARFITPAANDIFFRTPTLRAELAAFDGQISERVAEFYADLNALHPFRKATAAPNEPSSPNLSPPPASYCDGTGSPRPETLSPHAPGTEAMRAACTSCSSLPPANESQPTTPIGSTGFSKSVVASAIGSWDATIMMRHACAVVASQLRWCDRFPFRRHLARRDRGDRPLPRPESLSRLVMVDAL